MALHDLPAPRPAGFSASVGQSDVALLAVPAQPHLSPVADGGVATSDLDFDSAVHALAPRLQRYATRRLGDAAEAAELVQEAVQRARQHRDGFATKSDLAAWSTCETGRLVVDRLKIRNRVTSPAELPLTPNSRQDQGTTDITVARDEARMTLDALDAMPAHQAAVLWAREVEGLGFDEIGARFDLTEPAVQSLLTLARKALRREYSLRGGALPFGGLAVLAPWVDGMSWLRKVRSGLGKLAAPLSTGTATIALLGVGILGLVAAPYVIPSAPSLRQAVAVNADAQSAAPAALVSPTSPQPAALTVAPQPSTAPDAGNANPLHRVVTALQKPPCVKSTAVDAGGKGCTPSPSGDYFAVGPHLPENPTGVRDVTVVPGAKACWLYVDNVLIHCYSDTPTKDAP